MPKKILKNKNKKTHHHQQQQKQKQNRGYFKDLKDMWFEKKQKKADQIKM